MCFGLCECDVSQENEVENYLTAVANLQMTMAIMVKFMA